MDRPRSLTEPLARALAHDLRQPLNVLRLFSQVHRRRHPDEERIAESIDRAVTDLDGAFDRLALLLRTPPAQVGDTSFATVWPALDPALVDGIDAPEGSFPIDRASLVLLLTEVLANAREHAEPPYTVKVGRTDDAAWLVVEDGGPGIDPSWLSSTRLGGPGRSRPVAVGLAIVQQLLSDRAARCTILTATGGLKILLPL